MTNLLKSVPPESTHVTEQLRSLEFAELRPRLIRHARLLVRDTSVAEDLVQETLLAVFIQRQQQFIYGRRATSHSQPIGSSVVVCLWLQHE